MSRHPHDPPHPAVPPTHVGTIQRALLLRTLAQFPSHRSERGPPSSKRALSSHLDLESRCCTVVQGPAWFSPQFNHLVLCQRKYKQQMFNTRQLEEHMAYVVGSSSRFSRNRKRVHHQKRAWGGCVPKEMSRRSGCHIRNGK